MANETEILIVNGVEYTLIDSTAVHTVDSGLSTSSSNPVKNSAITAEVNKKPTLLKFGPYTATLTGEYYTFPFPYIDIGGIATSHDGIVISFSSSSAFRPNSTLIAFKNEASLLNGVNVNAYSGTLSDATTIDSNTFVCILPTSGTSSGGTGYIKAATKIADAINALDAAIDGLGTGKTITALSETNGIISATASNIAIAGSQVTSGTIAEARLPSTVAKKSDEMQTTNPFAPGSLRGPYISKIDNAFYAAPKRWTVTSTPTGSVDPLFNGDYESTRNIAAGTSCTFNMKFDTESNGYFPGYPYGYILVSFYFQNIPASVTGRAYCNYESHGIGWHDIDFSVVSDSTVSNTVYRGRQAWYNISEIEITVTADASKSANITQIEMHLDRPNSARNPFLSKYAAETLYYGLTAPSFTGNLRGELNYGTCATAAGTAAKVVTCPGFVLVAGARISVRFTNGCTNTGTMTLNVNDTGAITCVCYIYGGPQTLTNKCSANDVLEFIYNGTYWVTLTPYSLRNLFTYGSRPTSANRSYPDKGLEYFLATSSMTTGKPPTDAHILNFNWDNGTTHNAQLAIGHGASGVIAGRLFTRGQPDTSTWSDWKEIPRLSSSLTNGQIVVSDESTGNALLKGGPTLDTTDTTKFLRHDGSWAEIGGGVAPVEDTDVFLSRTVNFGENKYKFPSLVGGSVAWNQLAALVASFWAKSSPVSISITGNTIRLTSTSATSSGKYASLSVVANHVYLSSGTVVSNTTTTSRFGFFNSSATPLKIVDNNTSQTTPKTGSILYKPTASTDVYMLRLANGAAADVYADFTNIQLIDLTLALGPTIADYIYSLEQATTGAGVNWFKQYFPKSYYPYNAGTLISVNPTGAETVGVNQWDEEWEYGEINSTTGANSGSATTAWRTKNYIPVIPGGTYYVTAPVVSKNLKARFYDASKNYIGYTNKAGTNCFTMTAFTVPDNASYVRFGPAVSDIAVPNNNICVSISNPLYNGTYYPYTHHSYPISPVELRGIPKLSDGKLTFDGDVRASDGTVTRKYGIVDLGTLTYAIGATSESGVYRMQTTDLASLIKPPSGSGVVANIVCAKYPTMSLDAVYTKNIAIGVSAAGSVAVYDPNYNTSSSPSAFKTAMSGVYLVYELATPTTESSAALPVPQVVYDGGTESYIDERDVQVPVGQIATYMDATSAISELMDSGLVPSSGGVSQTSGTFVLGGTGTTITSQWNYVKTGKEVTIYGGFANWMSSSTLTTFFGLPFTPAYSTPVTVSCFVTNMGKFEVMLRLNTDKTMTAEYACLVGTNGTVTNIAIPSSTFAYYLIYLSAEIRYITNE